MSDFAMKCAMKKRAAKMAKGGDVQKNDRALNETGVHMPNIGSDHGGESTQRGYSDYMKKHNISKRMIESKDIKPKLQGLADGGFVKDEEMSGFEEHEGDDKKHDGPAMMEDDRMLNEHGEYEEGPQGAWMAKGGMIGSHQSDADEMDMVHRIIGKHKERMYSKGGMIANGGDDDLDRMADGAPNNFDDLSLRDDLESSNSGANSGDELGNKAEEHDRDDIVSRVHKSWKKKDKNPRPA